MPAICFDENNFAFPPVDAADDEGLVLLGGRVTPDRVVDAYTKGIFPWYNDDSMPLWWSPDPRFVLFPHELHVSRSMKKLMAKPKFEFQTNTAFDDVLMGCAVTPRKGAGGTWLTPQMQKVYGDLHRQGVAHSAEAWTDGKLVGGVYGVRLGLIFFAESMFSLESNASKFALIRYVQKLQHEGVAMLDCQVHSAHVETLGARSIPRTHFIKLLDELL